MFLSPVRLEDVPVNGPSGIDIGQGKARIGQEFTAQTLDGLGIMSHSTITANDRFRVREVALIPWLVKLLHLY